MIGGQPLNDESAEDDFQQRLYEAYAATDTATFDEGAAELAFRRDILRHLPEDADARILDLGCGQGQLVKILLSYGYRRSTGIDISPEQVALAHESGVPQVRLGDYRNGIENGPFDVITATNFFEHLTRPHVVEGFDRAYAALDSSGALIVRVPNSVSPFSGNFQYGDFTHESSFTARSLRQIGTAVGFGEVRVYACAPPVHGVLSLGRNIGWRAISGGLKLALAAETGVSRGHLVTQNVVAVMRKSVSAQD
jgi:cyclopropane fatty-acyl-phospholipid synthase-like methyltransferase